MADDRRQVDELIVSVDDDRRRIAYAVKASPFSFEPHHASVQIDPDGDDGSWSTWIRDVKPDESATPLTGAIDVAVKSFKRTLT